MNGVVLNFDGVKNVIQDYDFQMIENDIYRAHEMLKNKKGPGNNFLGWLDLPENRDEEEILGYRNALNIIQLHNIS